jgi:hypothetical protein
MSDNLQTDMSITVEDELSDFTADLLSERQFEPLLEQLFAKAPGRWLAVAPLLGEAMSERLEPIEATSEGTLLITWMDHPESFYGDGYCTVAFFVESILWSSIAVYNQQRLLYPDTLRTKKATSVS